MIPIILPTSAQKPAARDPDVIDAFMAIDNELIDWILHASPTTDEERAQMRQVLALRTKLDQQVNKLIFSRMKLAAHNLDAHIPRLNAVTAAISETNKNIGTVLEILHAADEVVLIAVQVALVLA